MCCTSLDGLEDALRCLGCSRVGWRSWPRPCRAGRCLWRCPVSLGHALESGRNSLASLVSYLIIHAYFPFVISEPLIKSYVIILVLLRPATGNAGKSLKSTWVRFMKEQKWPWRQRQQQQWWGTRLQGKGESWGDRDLMIHPGDSTSVPISEGLLKETVSLTRR